MPAEAGESRMTTGAAESRMTTGAGDAVLIPLHAYIRGHATGDPAHFRQAFLPTAHIEGIRNGTFVS
jgi:hypothetical protein